MTNLNRNLTLLQKRSHFRRLVRSFFERAGFLEVVTPLLVKNPGFEPEIQYFETTFGPRMGEGVKQKLYLPTSPEYHLKKALAFGADRIFELTRAFRNGELGVVHSPEFEILEWYRQPGTYRDIGRDVEALLREIWREFRCEEPALKINHYSITDIFRSHAHVDLLEAVALPIDEFGALASSVGVHVADHDSFNDIFHRIFLDKIEPWLATQDVTFLWDFPAPLRALAKLHADPRFCQRFEVYWKNIELGNAFDELTDPIELERVCEADRTRRLKIYGHSPEIDREFVEAHSRLEENIGGIAMGLDRLLQWVCNADTLDEVLLFKVMRS